MGLPIFARKRSAGRVGGPNLELVAEQMIEHSGIFILDCGEPLSFEVRKHCNQASGDDGATGGDLWCRLSLSSAGSEKQDRDEDSEGEAHHGNLFGLIL